MVFLELTEAEADEILESLQHTKRAREAYDRYPNPDFKRERLRAIEGLISKMRAQLRR